MKNLICVRHGNYAERTGKLTHVGINQSVALANFMKGHLEGRFYINSSPLPRAQETAMILWQILNGTGGIKTLYELNCEYDNLFSGQDKDIYEAINKNKADNIVLVSHYSIRDFAKFFAKKEWDKEIEIDNLPKGKAIHISLEDKLQRIIP